MALTSKEKAVVLIANAIAAYSSYSEKGSKLESNSMIDFII